MSSVVMLSILRVLHKFLDSILGPWDIMTACSQHMALIGNQGS